MSWATFLHFYQPHQQKREIIDAIVAQCYRPVGEGILAHPEARVTINFAGVLLDQLAQYGHQDVIDLYIEAARRGQVEFMGSAKFHTILPLLPEAEALRQIQINDEASRKYLGDAYQRKGIFLPEMAYSPKLVPLLEKAGFEWVMLDELAYNGRVEQVDYSKLYQIEGSSLKAFFREHRLSATIMSAAPRDIAALKDAAREELKNGRYIITGMDGETFGHHRVGHEQLLFGMFADPEVKLARVSDLLEEFGSQVETIATVACSWASSEDDIAKGIPFISWDDPTNDIHKMQWELLRLTAETLEEMPKDDSAYPRLREQLDPALGSDQFFWSAARPWWMIEHIERGAHGLLEVLQGIPGADAAAARGLELYRRIMATAYDWQRSGKIDDMSGSRKKLVRIPFKELSLEKGDEATWHAFVDLMKREEKAAAQRGDYETAILWRDGIYKLEHKLDIYDSWYILDILRHRLPKGEVEETLARYKRDFDRIRGGQVEQRSN